MRLQLLDCITCIACPFSGFARELILIVVDGSKPCGDSHAAVAMAPVALATTVVQASSSAFFLTSGSRGPKTGSS